MAITSIGFFNHSPFEGPLPVATYQISFSTVTPSIDTLSNTNFDSNLGTDNTLFASADLSGPAPPQLVFAGGPFDYNPANGNLLMDIHISNEMAGGGAFYDAQSGTATGIFSRYQKFMLAPRVSGWSPNSPSIRCLNPPRSFCYLVGWVASLSLAGCGGVSKKPAVGAPPITESRCIAFALLECCPPSRVDTVPRQHYMSGSTGLICQDAAC